MAGVVLWSDAADSQSCTMCFTRETQENLASRLAAAVVGHEARPGGTRKSERRRMAGIVLWSEAADSQS